MRRPVPLDELVLDHPVDLPRDGCRAEGCYYRSASSAVRPPNASSQSRITLRARPVLPVWQWFDACSASVKTRAVTDLAAVNVSNCSPSIGNGMARSVVPAISKTSWVTRGETSPVWYSRQALSTSAGVAAPITRSPWRKTQSVSRSVLAASATAALTTGAGIWPEFAVMASRPEAPKALVVDP